MDAPTGGDFIRDRIRTDLAEGQVESVVTRFPPEPNGFLHIGHAKSICLNFGVAKEFGGHCNLRFDDTNPAREEQAYIDAIQEDVRWLGFEWAGEPVHASDYFETLYEWAEHLVGTGNAYVDEQSAEEIRETRGTLTEPGRPSPWRDRPAAESLDLLRRMRAGEFTPGSCVLRARIDMGSGNINMRDPVLYRILDHAHPRTGEAWRIYPTYDYAHGQSDAIEGVTHSLCTLEFADHRPLYDWLLERVPAACAPAPVRVRPAGHDRDDPLQARADPPRRRRPCRRLGRPAHADPARPPPAGRAGGGRARLRLPARDLEERRPRGGGAARPLRARTAEPHRRAAHGRAAPAQGRDRKLPRGRDGVAGGRQQSGRPGCRQRARSRSRASSGSSATTSWKTRPGSSSASRPAGRCACATPFSSPAWKR